MVKNEAMSIVIKIKKKASPLREPQIGEDARQSIFLGRYLADSVIDRVGIDDAVIEQVDAWVRQSLTALPVHETGGFLLGGYRSAGLRRWDIDIRQFCPARTVEYSSPNRLAFGCGAFRELDGAMDAAPDLCLLGWFHTHPGLTPYLSGMDLSIHDGFFRAPWQIAIVLDSLTPGFDTGIFSRKTDGRINNKTNYPPGDWIHWKNFGSGI